VAVRKIPTAGQRGTSRKESKQFRTCPELAGRIFDRPKNSSPHHCPGMQRHRFRYHNHSVNRAGPKLSLISKLCRMGT
jgi:hypothetical protein